MRGLEVEPVSGEQAIWSETLEGGEGGGSGFCDEKSLITS